MKNLLFLFLGVLILASCSNAPNKITARSLARQGNYYPLTDSVKALIDEGFVYADASHAGNPLIRDSVYTLEFNTAQKWAAGGKWPLFVGIFICVVGLGIFIWTTSSGNDKLSTMGLPIGAILVGGLFIGGFYFFNEYRDIKKSDYVHYMQADGNLDNWWKLPAQSY